MEKIAVERSIWIEAPRERVWQAVTEPEHIEKWFLPPALGAQMKSDGNGKLSVHMGPMGVDVVILEVVNPLQQVTSRSLPDKLITTTYTLAEEKEGTRVTVTMSGFEALPEDARQDRINPSAESWEKALENLKAYLAGKELPFPEGFLASLFGFRRETKEKIAVERSIWIAAPRERVWRAITDPEQLEKWFSPGTQWHGTGLEVGGKFSVYNAETDTEMYTQVIELVDPLNQLVTRSVPDSPSEAAHTTTWTLKDEKRGTRLTITDSGYEQDAAEIRGMTLEQNAFGFGMMLENLQAYAEGLSLPYPGGF